MRSGKTTQGVVMIRPLKLAFRARIFVKTVRSNARTSPQFIFERLVHTVWPLWSC
jgi:hypothetical protein